MTRLILKTGASSGGEMVKRNAGKIKKWFPKINTIDFERKIFDECVSFLENGGMPYYDLNI